MKKRFLSIVLCLSLVLTLLPTAALAALTATNITVTDAAYYNSGAVKSVSTKFGWNQAGVTGRLVLMTQRLRSAGEAGTDSNYGDFSNSGYYADNYDWDDFEDVVDFDTTNSNVFGIVSYTEEKAISQGTDNNEMDISFAETAIPLNKNATYYVYFWTLYQGEYYPDNLFLVFQVENGGVRYAVATDAADRNTYGAFSEVVSRAKYSVTVTPGANMTKTSASGAESQTDLSTAMTPVVYTANDGYCFPEDYAVATVNGIMVRRDSDTQITVYGTPSDNVSITLTDASAAAPTSPGRSYDSDGNVFLGNGKMELGINGYGSFGTTVSAPDTFHPWSPDSDNTGKYIGLVSAPFGTYRDYFLPGTVDEGFLFCWGGSQQAYVKSSYRGSVSANNYVRDTAGTVNTSTGDTLSATSGGVAAEKLNFKQTVSFKEDEGFATVTITLTNTSSETLTGVEFIRGFDPDQGSEYETSNYYHVDSNGTVWVVATPTNKEGEFTSIDWFATGITAPFIFAAPASADYTVVPTAQRVNWTDGFKEVTTEAVSVYGENYKLNIATYADRGIGLKFKCGDMAPDASVTISYIMSLDTDVSNAFDAVQGAISGGGIASPTGSVTLELSRASTSIVVKVDGVELTCNEHYTIDLTNPLQPKITFLAAAGLTHKSVITVVVDGTDVSITNNIPAPTTAAVTFVDYDGTVLKTETVEVGTAAVAPNAPARVGYTFTGWDKDFSNITADLTVTAQYTINTYTVTFMDGATQLDQKGITHNVAITKPADPTKAGYFFGGWYTDAACTNAYDFAAPVTGNLTLYAKWIPIPVYVHSCTSKCGICGGCTDPACSEGVCADKCRLLSMNFVDVAAGTWYTEAVEYVYHHGMMEGVGSNLFDVDGTTSRAMIVTILWRLEGCPVVNALMQFEDVPAGTWYTEAVRWAAAEGIVTGYAGKFDPMDAISREQLAAILWRYARYKGYDVSVGEDTNILSYSDAFGVSEYAIPALQWACGEGIIKGKNGALDPQGSAKRCEAATMLMRFCELYK